LPEMSDLGIFPERLMLPPPTCAAIIPYCRTAVRLIVECRSLRNVG
jgi:hypothetical protein